MKEEKIREAMTKALNQNMTLSMMMKKTLTVVVATMTARTTLCGTESQ